MYEPGQKLIQWINFPAIERYDAATTFELVLMDIQMPVMDGLTATMKIRGLDHPASEHLAGTSLRLGPAKLGLSGGGRE